MNNKNSITPSNFLKDKFLDRTKFKVFAAKNFTIAKIITSVFDRVEKYCGKKKKMLVTSIFSFSHNVFKELQFKSPYCVVKSCGPCKLEDSLGCLRKRV